MLEGSRIPCLDRRLRAAPAGEARLCAAAASRARCALPRKGGVGRGGWGEGRVSARLACGIRVAAGGLGCPADACYEMAILGAEG